MCRLWPAVSVIAGTIFEQSKKPLVLWFRAIFEVTASKQGIAAAELQRKLGLGSYQTAWSWLTKIRTAMVRPNREPLFGEVEIDESYVGGPEPGKPGRAAAAKAIVAAAVEKRGKSGGRVRLGVIANVSADVLTAFVDNYLGDGETAHTDGWRGYAQLGKTGDRHIVSVVSKLDHTAAEVLPRVHLIFSLLKRWILSTHQGSVSLKHLDGSLEEFTFRFNRRRARRITHAAELLLGIAMTTPPRPFWKSAGRPRPQAKVRTRRRSLMVMSTQILLLFLGHVMIYVLPQHSEFRIVQFLVGCHLLQLANELLRDGVLDLRLVDEAGLVELLAHRRIEDFFLQHGVDFQLRARHAHEILFLHISALQLLEFVENLSHFAMIFHQQRSRISRLGASFALGFGHLRLASNQSVGGGRRAA